MNKVLEILEKIQRLISGGKFSTVLKSVLFLNAALFFGIWLGLKLFFPDDFVLSKINNALFIKDMGLVADDVSISPFGNISFYDGTLTKKGEDVVSFQKLKFSPSLFDLISGRISGNLYVNDINNQGGELDVSFETSEKPCYSFDLSEVSLSMFKAFLSDISFTGIISGEGNLCMSENMKYSGEIDLNGSDIILRGKVPTPMGPLDVGSIALGEIEFVSKVADNKVDIEKFLLSGLFNFDILGKMVLNSKAMVSSRIDLDMRIGIPDVKKLAENAPLNLLVNQMAQYKTDKENNFAITLRGFLAKPQVSRAPKERVVGKTKSDLSEAREKRAERARARPVNKNKFNQKPVSEMEERRMPDSSKESDRFGHKPVQRKVEEPEKEESVEKAERTEKSERIERTERVERSEKSEVIESEKEATEVIETPVEMPQEEVEEVPVKKSKKEAEPESKEEVETPQENSDSEEEQQ